MGQQEVKKAMLFCCRFWNFLPIAKIGKVSTYSSTQKEERLEKRKGVALLLFFLTGMERAMESIANDHI
jgi:hypothetical protein